MAEPTVKEDELDIRDTDATVKNEPESPISSEDTKVWEDGKYPKYQKMLAKKYWGDERLKDFNSIEDIINKAINPVKNAPEEYDIKPLDDKDEFTKSLLDEFKKADMSNDSANAVKKLIDSKIPKVKTEDSLREEIGLADYEMYKAFADKAVNTFCEGNDALKDALTNSEVRFDENVFRFLKIVGENLGSNTVDFKSSPNDSEKTGDPFMDIIYGRK